MEKLFFCIKTLKIKEINLQLYLYFILIKLKICLFAIYKIIKKNLFFSFENILNKVSQNIKQKHNLLLRPYNLFLHINIITNFKTKFIKNIFKLLN